MRDVGVSMIDLCVFKKNIAYNGGAIYMKNVIYSSINSSTFYNNYAFSFGGSISVFPSTELHLYNNTFHNNTSARSGGSIFITSTRSFTVKDCKFLSNMASRMGGAIYIINVTIEIISCYFFNNNSSAGGGIYVQGSGHIGYTVFENNTGSVLGQAMYYEGNLTLRNIFVGSLGKSGTNIVDSQTSLLRWTNVTLIIYGRSAQLVQDVYISVLSLSSYDAKSFKNVNIYCPVNHNARRQFLRYLVFPHYHCLLRIQFDSCLRGSYSITGAKLYYNSLLEFNFKSVECFKCPSGGNCNYGIISNSNFWGYRTQSTKHIAFLPCPSGYCCSHANTMCTSYNTCKYGRKGILCGACKDNFIQSFSSDGCIFKDNKCNSVFFII